MAQLTISGVSSLLSRPMAEPPPTGALVSARETTRDAACAVAGRDAVGACDAVIDLLSLFFNVSGGELRSSRRTATGVARVRQIGMYVAHVALGLPMAAVGEGFGRDKSTVVHACHTIENMRDDEEFDVVVARAEMLVTVAFALERGEGARNG